MAFIAVLIGAILIVAAIRNSHKALFSALGQDVPGYVVWAAAILAIGVIGWIPGLSPLSRGLLALVILVIVLNNYKGIITGFEGAFKPPPGPANGQATAGTTPDYSTNGVLKQLFPDMSDLDQVLSDATQGVGF
jgi:hypothetical protein